MKKFFPVLLAALLAASCGTTKTPQDKLTAHDKEIDKIIAQMTLEEKVNMLHSKTNMSSAGVERLNIADMHYADGPFGIREEGVPNGFQSAGWTLDSATYFPTGSALAATWSKEMAYLSSPRTTWASGRAGTESLTSSTRPAMRWTSSCPSATVKPTPRA